MVNLLTGQKAIVFVALAASVIACGCDALLITLRSPCQIPGVCGRRGAILFSSGAIGLLELDTEREHSLLFTPETPIPNGFVFKRTGLALRLYVATDSGLYEHDGLTAGLPLKSIELPDCTRMGDLTLVNDGSFVVTCPVEARLKRLDARSLLADENFACCVDVDEAFEPFAITVRGDGVVLTGRKRIYAFDGINGEPRGLAVDAGVAGAETYDDLIIGPDGDLYVSANPDIGVLHFDGQTYEFIRVLVAGGSEGVPNPAALAFDEDGRLFVGSKTEGTVRAFNLATGEPVGEPIESSFYPIVFMAFRP